MKIIFVLFITLMLNGCSTQSWKSSLSSAAGTVVVTKTIESNDVEVMDLSVVRRTEENDNPNSEIVSVESRGKTNLTLLWFFFSMMAIGIFGAGMIGIVEAIYKSKEDKENKKCTNTNVSS